MTRDQLEGPPWGRYVDPDEAYLRGQTRQAGSGLLGGLGQAWYGGAVETRHELEDETRQAIAELERKRLEPPSR